MGFVHLHVHSEYSLLDGACRIRDLVSKAKEFGQTSIAVTDHGVMYGAVVFYKEAVKAGIKPIIGCEVYVAARTRFDKDFEHDSERHHLVLLCKDETGYKNLCQMVSASFTEGFYTKPRVDMDLLKQHSEGLVALSACISGEIPKLIAENKYIEAKAKAKEFNGIFGEGNFYLELQNQGFAGQPEVNAGLIKLSKETGIPLVVTNDVHYMTRSDAEAQDILMCIQTGKKVDDTDRLRFESEELYLKSEEDMRKAFSADALKAWKQPGGSSAGGGDDSLSGLLNSAFDNTTTIAEKCNFNFDFSQHHLPEFKLPDGETSPEVYLKKLCRAGLERRYGEDNPDKDSIEKRLDYELGVIADMGFTDYFLIMSDCIDYCKSIGIPIGPGRGSAAGSIVSYCLGITNVDPIRYNLFFERFLNPERVTMPDIDIDFCERRRGEAIEYVKRKYGTDRVAQIVTFGTLKAKNAVRSVSKAIGLSFQEESELARAIPDRNPADGSFITLQKALDLGGQLKTLYDDDPRVKRVVDTAMALEDMPKDSGTHASGVVITRLPVKEYLPLTLSKKDNTIATQYTMGPLEELGLLKMDFLGLRNLTVIDDTVREIRKTQPDFNIDNIPEDDEDTFKMLAEGKTSGVFQLESQGMTGVSVGLGPKSIEDITAVIALYRPGPMESIPRFLEWSRKPELIKYKHPLLEPILSVTYGCIVYQEQVIEIFRKLGGFSIGQADMIRRAMSKKKVAEIDRERQAFIEGDPGRGINGAVKNGVPKDVAAAIYDEIYAFANYAFNKSHAVGYAIISYQTAYLKCHYPHIYMASLLSSVLGNPDKISEYTATCRKMGINLLPPGINESGAMFTVDGENLRYGLVAVKNIGHGLIEKVVQEREAGGKFTSFEDFCRRMYGGELNRRALESLIKCGCFDGLGANRRQLMMVCQLVLDDVALHKRKNIDGQMDLFGMLGGDSDDGYGDGYGDRNGDETDKSGKSGIVKKTGKMRQGVDIPDLEEFSKNELTRMEREVTGLYLSGHPIDDYKETAAKAGAVNIGEILAQYASDNDMRDTGGKIFKDNQKVTIAGVIETVTTKPTRNNSLMAYIKIDDGTGTIEMLAFARAIDEAGEIMRPEEIVLVQGKLSERDEKEPQIVIDSMCLLKDAENLIHNSQFTIHNCVPLKTPNCHCGLDPQSPESNMRFRVGAHSDKYIEGHNSGNSKGNARPVSSNLKTEGTDNGKTLYVQIESEDSEEYRHLKRVHMMFPGRGKMIVYFKDTKKKAGASCAIHDAFVEELVSVFGRENVVVK